MTEPARPLASSFDTPGQSPSSPSDDAPLSKTTLEKALQKEEPAFSVAAGRLRGVMNQFGLRVEHIGGETEDKDLPPLPTAGTEDEGLPPVRSLPSLAELKIPKWVQKVQYIALGVSAAWIVIVMLYLVYAMGAQLLSLAPHELGGVLAGVLAPLALLWLGLTHITRAHDAQRYGQAMRAELHALIFPSEDRQQQISHDIEKLCEQAAQLEQSSRITLKAIQKSRLALQQETRDFLILTKKAEAHIEKLSAGLNDRTQQLENLTQTIETRTQAIDARTRDGARAWDDTAAHIMGKAEEIETALLRGTDKLLAAATQAQSQADTIDSHLSTTVENLSVSIEQVTGRLSDLSSEFDTHGQNLSRATDHVVDETTRLGQIIETQVKDLEGMATGVFETVSKSSEMIRAQRDTLDEGATGILKSAQAAADQIKNGTAMLEQAHQQLDSHAAITEKRILSQKDALKSVIEDMESKTKVLEQTGDAVAHHLSESLSVVLSSTENLSTAVRRASESLGKVGADTQTATERLIATTSDRIDLLQQSGAAQMTRLQTLSDMLDQTRNMWTTDMQRAEEKARAVQKLYEDQVAALDLAVTHAADKLRQAGHTLDTPIEQVQAAVKEADLRHELIEQTLARRTDDLSRASDKARESADYIQSALRTQAQDLSLLSGQISGHMRTINEQIVAQKDLLGDQTKESERDLEQVRAAIARQADSLQKIASDMNTDLSRLHDRLAEKTSLLRADTEGVTSRLQDLDKQIDLSSDQIRSHMEMLREEGIATTTSLDEAMAHAEPLYQRAYEQAHAAQEKLDTLNKTFDETTSTQLEKLQQMGIVFDGRLTALRSGVQESTTMLRSAGDELRARVEDIEGASVSASERLDHVSKTLNNQITDIHILTDQAVLKIDSIQKAVDEKFHELNAAVGKAVTELQGAQNHFVSTKETLEQSADDVTRRLQDAAGNTLNESNVLQSAAASVIKSTQDMISSMQAEAKTMLQAAHDALLDMKKTGDSFAVRAREVDEHMKSSLHSSQSYGHELKAQAATIAEASIDTAEKISRSVAQLSTKISDVERAAQAAQEKVEVVRGRLEGEAGRFIGSAKQAVDAAEDASSAYVRQSGVLFKAAQEAAAQMEKIREAQNKVQRDTFLSSAKFVIESLHSLSVDFVRMLDGGVQDKTWKAFQKGDTAAFTHLLLERPDALPHDKIRAKYGTDGEFRGYIQKFVRQFEDLFDGAQTADHGELLTATFLSSDIGRLYTLICTATGRTPRTGRDLEIRTTA